MNKTQDNKAVSEPSKSKPDNTSDKPTAEESRIDAATATMVSRINKENSATEVNRKVAAFVRDLKAQLPEHSSGYKACGKIQDVTGNAQ